MIKRTFKHLRTKIFAGILVVLPLGITLLVLNFVFNTLDNILAPLFPHITFSLFEREFIIPGMGIISFFILLYLFGIIATNVLGRQVVARGDRLFAAIPVVKNIYTASKQLTDAFSATRKGSFRQAVFVEFPQGGNYMLGFITNEVSDVKDERRVTVFVPTAFVPPQGFLLFLPKEKIILSRMTIEDAIKTIMSVGIVTPQNLSALLPGTESNHESSETFGEIKYPYPKTEGGH
ncbi:MAG: hypothetical protein A2170_00365 [Deltaproteobacteria bacterium RBG_13_53_10]|nr:MAG: hypothetical protein A2170_00365 [Deltaproteobacteria bacterium RBG_13_53_10]